MIWAFLAGAHDALPHWSPFAIACGFVVGAFTGGIVTAWYALHLLRRSAGSGIGRRDG